MKVRYLGPHDVFAAGGIRIRRGQVGELSKSAFDALGPARSRLEVVPEPRAAKSSKSTTAPRRQARSPKPKKES